MKMTTMMPEHFKFLKPILEARVAESNLADVTIDNLWLFLENLYATRSGGVYVDNVENPSHCVVIIHYTDPYCLATHALIALIYSTPEKRGEVGAFDTMVDVAENYARLVGAKKLLGASWVYKGAKAIDALWESRGFEPQEHRFIKPIT